MNRKYLKVMFGNKGANFEYKIDEVNIATNWNPVAKKGREFGGFNFGIEESQLRWLHRGDTLYDVIIPKGAEVVEITDCATPRGVFRSNQIIVTNPRKMTDELAMYFYKKSNIPEISYYKALGAVAIMGYRNTAFQIFRDKVNKDNINIVLNEWNDFIYRDSKKKLVGIVKEIDEALNEIQSEVFISLTVDKAPYTKKLTDDKVINITGESGSGKSYFSRKYIEDDNYIVIDTDIVFGHMSSDNIESLEIRELFKDQSKDILITNFDEFYLTILDYFKNRGKTIVIDSAQYRNIKDVSILKGEVIVIRTCIDTCYQRCVHRWKCKNLDYKIEDLEKFSVKKLGMYQWYKSLNKLLSNIEKLR